MCCFSCAHPRLGLAHVALNNSAGTNSFCHDCKTVHGVSIERVLGASLSSPRPKTRANTELAINSGPSFALAKIELEEYHVSRLYLSGIDIRPKPAEYLQNFLACHAYQAYNN